MAAESRDTEPPGAAAHWAAEAERWAAWARTPGHDAYWCYRHAFFALIPPPGRATLEVGCGEGRVARDLSAAGHRVTAVDLPAAVLELARVLAPGGRLGVCITHPLWDAGRFATPAEDAPFVIEGAYLGRRPYAGTFERDGLRISFRGWCHPLEEYAAALERAGLLVEALREPVPDDTAPPGYARHRRLPSSS